MQDLEMRARHLFVALSSIEGDTAELESCARSLGLLDSKDSKNDIATLYLSALFDAAAHIKLNCETALSQIDDLYVAHSSETLEANEMAVAALKSRVKCVCRAIKRALTHIATNSVDEAVLLLNAATSFATFLAAIESHDIEAIALGVILFQFLESTQLSQSQSLHQLMTVNAFVHSLCPLFHCAIESHDPLVWEMLLSFSVFTNHAKDRTIWLIDAAASKGNVAATTALYLLARAHDNATPTLGRVALRRAVEFRHEHLVAALLEFPEIESIAGNSLVDRTDKNTPLMIATQSFDDKTVEVLLRSASVRKTAADAQNVAGKTALMQATMTSQVQGHNIVQKLLSVLLQSECPEACLNARCKKGFTALMYAARFGSSEVFLSLLALPAIRKTAGDASDDGSTLFMLALEHEDLNSCAIAKALFACPNAVETLGAKNNYGYTALMSAAQSGSIMIVTSLLKFPEVVKTINATTRRGRTAEMLARLHGHTRVADLIATVKPF